MPELVGEESPEDDFEIAPTYCDFGNAIPEDVDAVRVMRCESERASGYMRHSSRGQKHDIEPGAARWWINVPTVQPHKGDADRLVRLGGFLFASCSQSVGKLVRLSTRTTIVTSASLAAAGSAAARVTVAAAPTASVRSFVDIARLSSCLEARTGREN